MRAILEEQEFYEYAYDIVIQPRDMNMSRHADHKSIIAYVHDSRANYLRELGLSEQDLGDGKTGDVLGDMVINYKKECFTFDALRFLVHLSIVSDKAFRMFYKAVNKDTGDTVMLAEAGFVCFDYQKRAVSEVPEQLISATENFIANGKG
ncbi:MAG: hypothetical protein C0608_09355 [Deltaproteobacteria bacterium]|nr:MAG: hypothetical protein C0608_09355 [Deltaproteobacteria bacterium]